jgi:hypothetical protein
VASWKNLKRIARARIPMKRVIDRKIYDTENAERIARHNPVADRQDFAYLDEVLYKTEKGNYFLHGTGGPKTKYAKKTGNGTTGSEEIKPMTEEEALNWCEENSIDGDIVVEEFEELLEQA